ncbi:hypothetical protein ACFX2I_004045 [Malus domestica]
MVVQPASCNQSLSPPSFFFGPTLSLPKYKPSLNSDNNTPSINGLLSATIMPENANKKIRGSFIAVVFAMQGFGILAGMNLQLLDDKKHHSPLPQQ